MTLSERDMVELRNALLDVEFGKIEIQIHAGAISSIAVTKVTKQALTKGRRYSVNSNGRTAQNEGGRDEKAYH